MNAGPDQRSATNLIYRTKTMKRLIILTALTASGAMLPSQGSAAINSPDARGFFDRGVAMYNDKNYNGCLDQLLQIRNLSATDADAEEVLYYMAMATLHSGDDEALALLQTFLMRYPASQRTQDVMTTIGDYYFTRGSYGEAIDAYAQVNIDGLTADRAEDLLYRKFYSHLMLGENDRALSLLELLKPTRRYANAALFYEGYIAYSRQNYAEARRLLESVDASREPGDAAAYYICQLDFLEGKYADAKAAATELLRQPRLKRFAPELKRIAGESLYNMGKPAEALPYLREYISEERSPRPSACYILGVDQYDSGKYMQAIETLQKAVGDRDVIGQSAYLYLGKSYIKVGNINAGMLAFEKSSRMTFSPSVAETASYDYIAARLDGGRVPFGNSIEMLENFLKKYPDSEYADNVRESLVNGYLSDSDYENALRILNSAKNPTAKMIADKQVVLLMLGVKTYHNGDPEKAFAYFNEGATLRGGKPDVARQCTLWKANCLYDMERYDEAAADYLDFLENAPANDANRLSAYYNLGYTRLRQERYEDAFKDFKRVADNKSAGAQLQADALNRAGDALYCRHRFAEASTYYDKAYKTYPQAGDYALFQKAEMSGYDRNYRDRIATLDIMLERFPSSALVAEALMAKAESHSVLGQNAEASAIYRSVIDKYPTTAQGRKASLMLAMTLLNNGERQKAIDAYKNVATTYPTSQEARVALDDLRNLYAADGRLPDYVAFVNSIPEANKIDMSALESTAFASAEEAFTDSQSTDRLLDYLVQYPDGAHIPAALLYLAQDAADGDDLEKAEGYAARIVEQYPDSPQAEDALLIKAESEADQGKGEMALETYRRLAASASTPRMLYDARMGLLLTAIELDRPAIALETADQLLASSASGIDRDQIEFYRATALNRSGKSEEAYQIWSRLAKEPSTLFGSKSAVYLIEALTGAGQLDRADKEANAFIDAGSPHNYWYARGFIAYSDLLRRQGKDFEADEYLKALRSNYPGDEADIFEMIDSRLEK